MWQNIGLERNGTSTLCSGWQSSLGCATTVGKSNTARALQRLPSPLFVMKPLPIPSVFPFYHICFFHSVVALGLAELLGAPCTQDRRTDSREAFWMMDGSWFTNERLVEKTSKTL